MPTTNTLDLLLDVSKGSFFLDTSQLAHLLGVQAKTIHNWQSLKKQNRRNAKRTCFPLHPIRHVGGRPLYHINDVAEYLDSLARLLTKPKLGRPTKAQEVSSRKEQS